MTEQKLRAVYVAVEGGEVPIKRGERLIAMEMTRAGGGVLGWNVLIGPDSLINHHDMALTGLEPTTPCPVCAERESEHE